MTDKINFYFNSSYRKKDETTSYLKCIVPSGLIKSYRKDFLKLSVTSFYCFSLDNCICNPNVYDIRNELNELLNGYVSITYDKIKNLYLQELKHKVQLMINYI